MSDWTIRIPHRGDRSDPVFEIGFAAGKMENEQERRIACQLAMAAIFAGHETVGDLIDEFEQLDVAGRRAKLDKARVAVGLLSTGEVDQRKADWRFEAAFERLQPPGPERWSPLQRCPHPQCGRYPTKDGGAWAEVEVEKWHCPEHADLAQPGDMDEHVAPYGIGPGGRLVPSAREKARLEAWHRERREEQEREREGREEHARRQGEALDEVRERFEREAEISVAGVRVHPDFRIVQ